MKMNRSLLFAWIFLVVALSKPLNFNKVVWATDSGNESPFRSAIGFNYKQDVGFSSNTRISNYNTNAELAESGVKYTQDATVYKTERHADESFTYQVPVESPGKYVLITKFVEMWFREAGKRAFNLKLGDCLVAEKLDIFEKVGRIAAYDEYTEFEMKTDQIFYKDRVCVGALKGNKLIVEFEKIDIDNPMVSGIVLYSGGLEDTDYYELAQMRSDWDRREEEEKQRIIEEKERKADAALRKFEKHRKRNDELDDTNEDVEDFDYESLNKKSFADIFLNSSLFLFFGMIGILVVILKFVGQRLEAGAELTNSRLDLITDDSEIARVTASAASKKTK